MFPTLSCLRTVLIWPCLLGVLAACATAPTQELSDAHQAIQAAEQAGAERLLATRLDQARLQLSQAQAAAGDGRFEQAREVAVDAKQTAMQTRQLAILVDGGEAAVQEARALGVVWQDTQSLLQQAIQSAEQGDAARAEALISRVRQQAALATNQYYLRQAQLYLDSLAQSPANTKAAWRSRLDKARAAYAAGNGKAAFEQSRRLVKETRSQ